MEPPERSPLKFPKKPTDFDPNLGSEGAFSARIPLFNDGLLDTYLPQPLPTLTSQPRLRGGILLLSVLLHRFGNSFSVFHLLDISHS